MDAQELQSLKNRYDIIGNDPALNRALEVAVSVAPADLTVLVVGESGVGKESIPKIIHQRSSRRTAKYFAVNCGAIPEGTIDSELFGHEKGSFTGATEMRRGYFEEADGGTLFLDEVGELPLSSQAKLLRVLQDGEFIRVGSSKVMKTDVRVIAATNVDLLNAVRRGRFRQDLYYRLNAVTIHMPALRERPEDIPVLFRKFAADFSEKNMVSKLSLTPDAVNMLKAYRWPGNIRQLKNFAEMVSALESTRIVPGASRHELSAAALEAYMPREECSLTVIPQSADTLGQSDKEALYGMIYQLSQEIKFLKEEVAALKGGTMPSPAVVQTPAYALPSPVITAPVSEPVREEEPEYQEFTTEPKTVSTVRSTELDMIRAALQRNGGNRKAAAAELGLSERTLYRKLKEINEK